jgi:hypothetical protein
VVEDLEDVLGPGMGQGVVERRGGVLQDECHAVDDRAGQLVAVVCQRREGDQDDQRGDGEADAHAVREAVGDLFPERVWAPAARCRRDAVLVAHEDPAFPFVSVAEPTTPQARDAVVTSKPAVARVAQAAGRGHDAFGGLAQVEAVGPAERRGNSARHTA